MKKRTDKTALALVWWITLAFWTVVALWWWLK